MEEEATLSALRTDLLEEGFDIVAPFKVSNYNELVPKYPLPDYGRKDTLGVIIGSSKIFWPKFVRYIKLKASIPKDPVQTYSNEVINKVLEKVMVGRKYDVRYDWYTPATGKYAHIQTIGHVAGVAFYDKETMWSGHSTFGLWFVFRAVVVLDADYTGPDPTVPRPILTPQEKETILNLTKQAVSEGWSNSATLLQIRLTCEHGKSQWQYEGSMLDYFYPIGTTRTQVLERILQEN